MRVATYNIRNGEWATWHERAGHPVDAASLAVLGEALADLDIDVVAFQEVDQNQERTGSLNQTEHIARAMGADDWRFAAHFTGRISGLRWRPTRSDAHGRPAAGIAIVSRIPIRSWHVLNFPLSLPKVAFAKHGDSLLDRLRVYDTTRAFLACTLTTTAGDGGNEAWSIGALHTPANQDASIEQQIKASNALQTLPGRNLLLGDLNVGPDVVNGVLPWQDLVTEPTFPSSRPTSHIDYILADSRVRASKRGIERLPFSDHCLMWADVH